MLLENIADQNIAETLSLYPNPTSDLISIGLPVNMKNGICEIYDINGKKVLKQDQFSGDELTVNTQNLNDGIYVIQLRSEKNFYSGSFVVSQK